MKQYIDKSAAVAEFNRLIAELVEGEVTMFEQGRISAFEDAKLFLDTIEVKEVDLKNEITQFLDTYFPDAKLGYKLGLRRTAKYFFELGIKTKGE